MYLKQIVIMCVAVAVLAAGIGFIVTSIGTIKPPDNVASPSLPKAPLDILTTLQGPRYEEAFTAGHHAFLFRSKEDTPTQVGVNWKNCKCAGVGISLAPPEWENLSDEELAKKGEDPNLQWTALDRNDGGFSIPAKAKGWIRVGWKDDKSTDTTFHADLWLHQPDSGISFALEVQVSFVDPVRIRGEDEPERADAYIGRLSAGDQKEGKFLIWSSTREKFDLEADPPRADPCITYGEPTKLDQKELDELGKRHGRKALSGYRVVMTIREHVGDKQLDIGPFRREVRWKSKASKEPVRGHLNGIVLGEVVALIPGSTGDPRLDMGSINPRRPSVYKVKLETDNPEIRLVLDKERTTSFLNVETPDGEEGKSEPIAGSPGRKTWTVNISYLRNSGYYGRFPDPDRPGYESCGVLFKIVHPNTKEEQLRRIKVPVMGQVRN